MGRASAGLSFHPINAEMCQMSCQTSLLSVWEGPGLQEQNWPEQEGPAGSSGSSLPQASGVSYSLSLWLAQSLHSVRKAGLRNPPYEILAQLKFH